MAMQAVVRHGQLAPLTVARKAIKFEIKRRVAVPNHFSNRLRVKNFIMQFPWTFATSCGAVINKAKSDFQEGFARHR